jgi:hypothetical protein
LTETELKARETALRMVAIVKSVRPDALSVTHAKHSCTCT